MPCQPGLRWRQWVGGGAGVLLRREGEGLIYVFQMNDPDHYRLRRDHRESSTFQKMIALLWLTQETARLFLAVPRGNKQAELAFMNRHRKRITYQDKCFQSESTRFGARHEKLLNSLPNCISFKLCCTFTGSEQRAQPGSLTVSPTDSIAERGRPY
jgi:hypothetical protein